MINTFTPLPRFKLGSSDSEADCLPMDYHNTKLLFEQGVNHNLVDFFSEQ